MANRSSSVPGFSENMSTRMSSCMSKSRQALDHLFAHADTSQCRPLNGNSAVIGAGHNLRQRTAPDAQSCNVTGERLGR